MIKREKRISKNVNQEHIFYQKKNAKTMQFGTSGGLLKGDMLGINCPKGTINLFCFKSRKDKTI